MKVAVIGSGIAGLAAAWVLRKTHAVTLYERNPSPGGHSNTLYVPTPEGSIPVDTGFMVYNEKNYPNLTGLFKQLGVATANTDMSFSVSVDRGRYEYAGDTFASLFAQRSNIVNVRHWHMLRDILRLNRTAKQALSTGGDSRLSLGEFLDKHDFHEACCNNYLLPMTAAIWSCPLDTMRSFPALSMFRFLDNHGLLSIADRPQWKTVLGGSRQYVNLMLDDLQVQTRVNDTVRKISRGAKGVSVTSDASGTQGFDVVVIASHADEALNMIDKPTKLENEILGRFRYQKNQTFLHSDETLMPRRRKAWASWNYLSEDTGAGNRSVSVTYWMNRLQPLNTKSRIFVSLNPLLNPSSQKIHAEIHYEHPVFDQQAMAAQTRLDEIQGKDRLWFCGSYFGFGFHEDALHSAVNVAGRLGATIPWETVQTSLPNGALDMVQP